ncbi:MAG: class II D-tagatose-bisphosphate aldolase, non-catalytic subunit [Anaerolineales bacterium]
MSKNPLAILQSRLQENKGGTPFGVFSVCSSHPAVIESTLNYSAGKDFPVLIESTCNQVNQFGGYSGKTPEQFVAYLYDISSKLEFPTSNLILGGDHLGPYPWRSMPAQAAMGNACQLVQDYVSAGYRKIHLDASMFCGDDDQDQPLDVRLSAQRTAQLCQAAEAAPRDNKINCLYIIGTEVPSPGGDQSSGHELQVTSPENVSETIQITKGEFLKCGLESAWERVIAVVVQPGVEFYDKSVHYYDPRQAALLSQFIMGEPGMVFEAHSTDYQTLSSLNNLVKDHFAILKVGPELTFVYREMIFALEQIELGIARYESRIELSNISTVIDQEMVGQPEYWEAYYSGTEEGLAFSRKYSYNDRIRYYWNKPKVQDALRKLYSNLTAFEIPLPLISQHLPEIYPKIIQGELPNHPKNWIENKIFSVLKKYHQAITP